MYLKNLQLIFPYIIPPFQFCIIQNIERQSQTLFYKNKKRVKFKKYRKIFLESYSDFSKK